MDIESFDTLISYFFLHFCDWEFAPFSEAAVNRQSSVGQQSFELWRAAPEIAGLVPKWSFASGGQRDADLQLSTSWRQQKPSWLRKPVNFILILSISSIFALKLYS